MFFTPPKGTTPAVTPFHSPLHLQRHRCYTAVSTTNRSLLLSCKLLRLIMASVAVARFGGALRSSGTVSRTIRTLAGPSPLARGGWVRPSTRCMSTVYAESHEYLIKVSGDGCYLCRSSRGVRQGAPIYLCMTMYPVKRKQRRTCLPSCMLSLWHFLGPLRMHEA